MIGDLASELEHLERQIANDPRSIEFLSAWTTCMAGAGHVYADVDAMYADVAGRLDAVDNGSPVELDAVRVHEFTVARATLGCGGGTSALHQPSSLVEVRRELEEAFVEEHHSALDLYRLQG